MQFHLSYNMLLNCVRVETVDVEMLIQKSFYTFQQAKAVPEMQRRQREVQALDVAAAAASAEIAAVTLRLGAPASGRVLVERRKVCQGHVFQCSDEEGGGAGHR